MDLSKEPITAIIGDRFEVLDAKEGYSLVIGDTIDHEWARKLRENNLTARAAVIDDKDRVRRATIAKCYQKESDIRGAFMYDASSTGYVKWDDFESIDPPEEIFAFVRRARVAHFGNIRKELFFGGGFVVGTYKRALERGDTITEYAVFGVMSSTNASVSITSPKSDDLYMLARFGNEGIIPMRELLYRQKVRDLAAADNTLRTETRKANDIAEREATAEKAITAYQHSTSRMVVHIGGATLSTAGVATGIVLLGLAAVWALWLLLLPMLVITGIICHGNTQDVLQAKAARLRHPALKDCDNSVTLKALRLGKMPKYNNHWDEWEFDKSVDFDPRLYKHKN